MLKDRMNEVPLHGCNKSSNGEGAVCVGQVNEGRACRHNEEGKCSEKVKLPYGKRIMELLYISESEIEFILQRMFLHAALKRGQLFRVTSNLAPQIATLRV